MVNIVDARYRNGMRIINASKILLVVFIKCCYREINFYIESNKKFSRIVFLVQEAEVIHIPRLELIPPHVLITSLKSGKTVAKLVLVKFRINFSDYVFD
jgi:hypothetical protein